MRGNELTVLILLGVILLSVFFLASDEISLSPKYERSKSFTEEIYSKQKVTSEHSQKSKFAEVIDAVEKIDDSDGKSVRDKVEEVEDVIEELPQQAAASTMPNLPTCYGHFEVGDSNGDGIVDLSDIVYSLAYLFDNGQPPVCLERVNVNGDLSFDVSDIVYMLSYMFTNGPEPLDGHRLTYRIHPDLAASAPRGQLGDYLQQYTDDLNAVFSQTKHRFVFNPLTDIVIDSDMSFHCAPSVNNFPLHGYEIEIIIDHLGLVGNSGGSAACDSNTQRGILYNLEFHELYDRGSIIIGTPEFDSYRVQFHILAHEMAHLFGAGIGEYYAMWGIDDTTGIPPIYDVAMTNYPNDPFWNAHSDMYYDPLFLGPLSWSSYGLPNVQTIDEYISTVEFTELSVAVINDPFRISSPFDLFGWSHEYLLPANKEFTSVIVKDANTNQPIQGAQVQVWKVQQFGQNIATMIFDDFTSANGEAIIDLSTMRATLYDGVFLIKVHSPNYNSEVLWYWVFDAQHTKMVGESDDIEIMFEMA